MLYSHAADSHAATAALMSPDWEILKVATDLIGSGEPFVLITVVGTQGSTPRLTGARMIWRPNAAPDGRMPNGTLGTVGGGEFEHLVLDAARKSLERRTHMLERFVLGADADQCCGGTVDVFLEYHGRPARVVVFGAGHVSAALAGLLAGTPVELVVVDDREEWSSAQRFPAAQRLTSWDEGVRSVHQDPERTLAVVMTCSHDTDFELLRKLLAKPPVFTGMIGSRSKHACLSRRLIASGTSEQAVGRVHCPIGVGDTGKDPHAIAISVAAQLLMEAAKLGTP